MLAPEIFSQNMKSWWVNDINQKAVLSESEQQYHKKSHPMEPTRTKEKRQDQLHMEEWSRR